jgi:hypothetical protein
VSESGAIVVSFVTPKIDLDGHDNGWKMKRKVLAVTQTRGISLRKERMVGEAETQYPVSCPSSDSRVTQPATPLRLSQKTQNRRKKLQLNFKLLEILCSLNSSESRDYWRILWLCLFFFLSRAKLRDGGSFFRAPAKSLRQKQREKYSNIINLRPCGDKKKFQQFEFVD